MLLILALGLVVFSAHGQSVSVSAAPSVITNAGDDASITLTIFPPSSKNLQINFLLSGTAAYGADYVLTGQFNRSGQILVPAGESSFTLDLHSFYDDDRPNTSETVIFTLLHGKKYRVGSPSRATVTIDNVP
jgi:hypothetical protein